MNKGSEGYTDFQPIGIIIDYTHVDLSKKQVTATISCNNDVKMTVITDLNMNKVYKEGSFDEILALSPSEEEGQYIEIISEWSKVFIENKITNPKKYFEQFL